MLLARARARTRRAPADTAAIGTGGCPGGTPPGRHRARMDTASAPPRARGWPPPVSRSWRRDSERAEPWSWPRRRRPMPAAGTWRASTSRRPPGCPRLRARQLRRAESAPMEASGRSSSDSQRSSGQIDEDSALLDRHRKARHLHRWVVGVGACRHVPAPGVPGAAHEPAVELALAERPAAVNAHVVHDVVRAVDIEQRQLFALGLDDAPLTHRDIAHRRDPHTALLSHSHGLRSPRTFRAPRDLAPPE